MNIFEKTGLLGFITVVSVKPITWVQFILAMIFMAMFLLGGIVDEAN